MAAPQTEGTLENCWVLGKILKSPGFAVVLGWKEGKGSFWPEMQLLSLCSLQVEGYSGLSLAPQGPGDDHQAREGHSPPSQGHWGSWDHLGAWKDLGAQICTLLTCDLGQ